MNKKLNLLFLILVVIAMLLPACEHQQPSRGSGKTVKIGFIGPMTGKDAAWGRNGLLGSRLALKMNPFLANGDTVELIVKDDGNTPELAVSALKKLVEEDQVAAVLIMSDSETVLGTAAMAEACKTPVVALTATHPNVTKNHYISQLVFNDIVQGTVAALYVRDELLIDHVAVFKDLSQPYSRFLADTFVQRFADAGGTVELIEFHPGGSPHIESLQRLREQGITFLYAPLSVEQVLELGQATQKLAWKPQMMASDGLLSQFRLQHAKHLNMVNGMLATDLFANGVQRTRFGEQAYALYKGQVNEGGTTFTVLGCEGMALLAAAIDRCKDPTDRTCINSSLRHTEDFEGFLGKISIREDGQAERAIFINQIDNSEMKFVVKVY